jgi:hypothetical protein
MVNLMMVNGNLTANGAGIRSGSVRSGVSTVTDDREWEYSSKAANLQIGKWGYWNREFRCTPHQSSVDCSRGSSLFFETQND